MTKIEQLRVYCRTVGKPFTSKEALAAVPMGKSCMSVYLPTLAKQGLIRNSGHRVDGLYLYELVQDARADVDTVERPVDEPKPSTKAKAMPSSLSLDDIGAAVMGHVERLERRIATLEGQAKDTATQARLRAAEHKRALDEKEQEKRRLADTIVELNGRIAALQVVRRPAVAVGRFFEGVGK